MPSWLYAWRPSRASSPSGRSSTSREARLTRVGSPAPVRFLPEGLVVAGAQAPHPVVGLPATAGQQVHVGEQGILVDLRRGRHRGVGGQGRRCSPASRRSGRLREAAAQFPAARRPPGGLRPVRALASARAGCAGERRRARPPRPADSGAGTPRTPPWRAPAARSARAPGPSSSCARARSGNSGWRCSLVRSAMRLGVVMRVHRGARLRAHLLCSTSGGSGGSLPMCSTGGSGARGRRVDIAGHRVVPDGEPGARVVRQRQVQQPVRLRAPLDRTRRAAGTTSRRRPWPRRRTPAPSGARARAAMSSGVKGLGCESRLMAKLLTVSARLADQDLAAAARAVDQPQPQAARIDALRDHEALALLEVEREGDLPGRERLDARGGDDVARRRRSAASPARSAPAGSRRSPPAAPAGCAPACPRSPAGCVTKRIEQLKMIASGRPGPRARRPR